MSYVLNTNEELELLGNNQEVVEIKKALVLYLTELLSLSRTESMDIERLELIVDDKSKKLSSVTIDAWAQDAKTKSQKMLDEMNLLIQLIENANHVVYSAKYFCMKYAGGEYGYNYFEKYLNENVMGAVKYKVLEFYDVDDEVVAYKFGMHDNQAFYGLVEMTNDRAVIEQIGDWYCGTFYMGIALPIASKFIQPTQLMHEFEGLIDEKFSSCELEEKRMFELTATLTGDLDMNQVIKHLSRIADFTYESNGTMNLSANCTPDASDEFAKLEMKITDGKFKVETCCY